MTVPVNASIVTHFQTLEDPRIARTQKRHLLDILVIAVCTLLTGGEGFQDNDSATNAGAPITETTASTFRALKRLAIACVTMITSIETLRISYTVIGRHVHGTPLLNPSKDHAPRATTSLRRIALSLRPKSLLCGLDENYLLTVLSRATQDAITLPVPATGSRGGLHSAPPSRSSRKKSSSSCISCSGLRSSSRSGRGASSPVAS